MPGRKSPGNFAFLLVRRFPSRPRSVLLPCVKGVRCRDALALEHRRTRDEQTELRTHKPLHAERVQTEPVVKSAMARCRFRNMDAPGRLARTKLEKKDKPMKTMTGATIAALAFGLGLATTPVFAADYAQYQPSRDRDQDATQQDEQNNKGDEKRDHRRGNRDNKADQPATTPVPAAVNDNDGRRGRSNTDYQNNRDNDNDRDRMDRNRRNNDNDNDRWRNNNDRRNDRDWNRDRRGPSVNINVYRRNVYSPRRYRHGSYRYPRGYNYRRYHYGQRLPVIFYRDRDYWLLDFIAFGLFAPPPGYVWVRYGPDALLIDTYTGEIVQVRYDVFYS